MGAVRQPNSPRRNHLNALGFLIKGVLSLQGFRWSDRTTQMSLALSAEEVSFNKSGPSVGLA